MKRKLKIKNIIIITLFITIISILIILFNNNKDYKSKENRMIDLSSMNIDEIKEYAKSNNIELDIKYEFNNEIKKDNIIKQSINSGKIINKNDKLTIYVSKGDIGISEYKEYSVNELGDVPIMMYHGIVNKKNSETEYTGGNVDKDGYHRTKEAFIQDLEFYYNEGYRMIRLNDYVNGIIDVELGKSPIILTFDDGLENNMKVLGKDSNGNLEIDPNCAVGILEEFKKKYPDYNVTATFFVMSGMFNQPEYNEDILKWLVEHGYDIGNHTKSHVDFTKSNIDNTQNEIGYIYNMLDNVIPNKYVNIIALPYGSPYKKEHQNFNYILSGSYEGKQYNTISTLRVGWTSELSPFNKNFDKTFLKRIRAYDNNGSEFDIEMTFNNLKTTKYISDGNKDKIVFPDNLKNKLGEINMESESY